MPNRIKPRRSYTANSVPLTSDLDTHELAINWVDGKAFTKDASGNIVSVTLGGSGGGGGSGGSLSGSVTIPASGDQYWANTALLLKGDDLTDSSSYARTVTAYGNAAATGTAKYGVNSLAFDGSGDYLRVAGSSAFAFPGDFTLEAWVYFNAASASFDGAYGACLMATYPTGQGGNQGWQLRINGTSTAFNTINVYTGTTDLNWSATFNLNQWHHVAVTRSGSSIRAFVDGVQVGSTVNNSDDMSPGATTDLWIGQLNASPYLFSLNGRLDDLRVTKGTARYTANFTPPAAALGTGAYTAAQTLPVTVTGSGGGGSGLTWSSVPASATATGTAGQISYDSSGYFYVCTAANTWLRAALSTWDSDATAFLTAAGITDATQSSAIGTLVGSLKSAGVWSKMRAIYPFIGGTASTHKWNLKDPRDLDAAYRLAFSGNWTHSATGVTPDGSTAYANTFAVPSTFFSDYTGAYGLYLRTNPASSTGYRVDMGAQFFSDPTSNRFLQHIGSTDGNSYYDWRNRVTVATSTVGSVIGFHVVSRTSTSLMTVYRNGNSVASGTSSDITTDLPNRALYIGAQNHSDGPSLHSNREQSFVFLSESLSGSEVTAVNAAVQAFQTALGRNV
jgi:hypothetical protein